ncbi:hypothetical protein [Wohlfahrtiimonas chitiniclastica]|uniref:hypothetical protein n=1 Tax=Wohlfahrtiimonas chitiniclastica TaxID=400946 RepID=UPI000B9870C1|nr:hypothetical protein [Wohlfahrtiimonas chitiniclastica]MBS7815898.1 hypothetical protein [Wohlfahrtiimonas chitiniclastica]MBS7822107.1 hypothetical protein [Wohlfahrtiimonas chitiniclastica]MBS7829899.1 hypothetical protein [Wohlfahrtiimonas chitiniclastica]MBS7831866.1 hypothetical protein [Wohlfahrtiimonas chitiniclastica]OYQ69119.1 hypothetical protein B9T13_09990 [Wohlfahrtiimonas chitiniclastica]
MIEVTSLQQLSNIKDAIIIFTNDSDSSDVLKDKLDGIDGVFNVDITHEIGSKLKEIYGVGHIPSAVFYKDEKASNLFNGIAAIMRRVHG